MKSRDEILQETFRDLNKLYGANIKQVVNVEKDRNILNNFNKEGSLVL